MKNYILITILAFFLLFPQILSSQVNKQDSLALVDLYNSTDGANWTDKENWLTKEKISSWYGITIKDNRVYYVNLRGNNLSKTLPSSLFNLTSLYGLTLSGNNLSGNIPSEIGNLRELSNLYLDRNNFSGNIPSGIGNLLALDKLNLDRNNLIGEIPPEIGNLTALRELFLYTNNLEGKIPPEIGNLTILGNLAIGNNNLSGPLPSEIGKLSYLKYLDVSNNNLEGSIPLEISNLTFLEGLSISNNYFDDIPSLSGNIKNIYISANNFDFGDLEKLSALTTNSHFIYSPQNELLITKKETNGNIELVMDAGGTDTRYQWYYNGQFIPDAKNKKYLIPLGKVLKEYTCRASNSNMPGLTLHGKYEGDGKRCWNTGQLEFCLSSNEKWGNASEDNKISATDIISINDFLFFNGTMTIDTSKFELEADGEFYIDNIPLAQNLGIGKYSLGEGKFNLTLSGVEKKITNFLNSELSENAKIFGAPIKIDDLQFFKRNDTIGIKVNSSVRIPLLYGGCGIPGILNNGTDIELKNLEITNKGILSAGFQVVNLGFLSSGCLKR